MSNYRFSLQKYTGPSSRHTCPACNEKRQFVLYIDTETGEILPSHVGLCNRRDQCGHHYSPKQYFLENGSRPESNQSHIPKPVVQEIIKPVSYLPKEVVMQSIFFRAIDPLENHFIKWLVSRYSLKTANIALDKYKVGHSDLWPGSTVFWQIDTEGNIHTGKIMLYDSETGKRVKTRMTYNLNTLSKQPEKFNYVNWEHSYQKLTGFNLEQRLFGEHLIALPENQNKVIAICESEKTAIIASIELPNYIWLSRGGLQGAKWYLPAVHRCLIGRKVVLFPDLGGFFKWSQDAELLRSVGCFVAVNDLLEKSAKDEDRKAGFDIADYLLKKPYLVQAINN